LRAATPGNAPEIKHALTRLSSEIKERAERGSIASADFFSTAISTISKIKGTVHADLRFNCLADCGLFFYRSGALSNALVAARSAGAIAERNGNKEMRRKANILLGIVHAELGDIAEGVVRYAAALELAR